MTVKITSNVKHSSPSFEVNLLRRRSSLYKPTLEDDELLRKSLSVFIESHKQQHLSNSHSPITWERLPTGYRIADFQIDRTQEAIEILKSYYFCSNKSCAAANLYIDSNTIRKYQRFILDIVSDYNSFCALEEGTGKIIGIALVKINHTQDEIVVNNDIDRKNDIFNAIDYEKKLLKKAKIYENYKVNKYFFIHAVCVIPDYHNNGIGTSLIQACISKAQKIQCSVCIGIFPAGANQTIANRLGFEMLAELPWIKVTGLKANHRHSFIDNTVLENSFVTCMGTMVPLDKETEIKSDLISDEIFKVNVLGKSV